ncbi:MAG: hypothetical protein Q9173_005037 [Seirophora scorigena]
MTSAFVLRPSLLALPTSDASTFQPPSTNDLLGDWWIVQTSLPYWRDKRNVKITYTQLANDNTATLSVQDDASYQLLDSDKTKMIRGINTLSQRDQPGAWDWRGTGWVKIVSNHWKILAYGPGGGEEMEWLLIHTEKSFFTPAAVHVYSRVKTALPRFVKDALVDALVDSRDLRILLEGVYEPQPA